MSFEQVWPSLVAALIGAILGTMLTGKFRHREANLATKRDVFRRIMANRHRLSERIRRGHEEPYLALNEAAFAFADSNEVEAALAELYRAINSPDSSDASTTAAPFREVLRTMARVCKFPIHREDGRIRTVVKKLKQQLRKMRKPADDSLASAVVAPPICTTGRRTEELTAKRDVFRRFVAYRYRLVNDWKLRRFDEEPYIALNEAVATFADCDDVMMELKNVYSAIQSRIDAKGDTEGAMESLRRHTANLHLRMAHACDLKMNDRPEFWWLLQNVTPSDLAHDKRTTIYPDDGPGVS